MKKWVSDSYAFSWGSFPLWFALPNSYGMVLLLLFVMFGYYLLEACSFHMRDREEVDQVGREDREGLGGVKGGL